jgi:capsular polysaccharide biosynthesis protein
VQAPDEVIDCDEIYVVWDGDPLAGLDAMLDRIAPHRPPVPERRIYIDRGTAVANGRLIGNRTEVLNVLAAHDIEAIDPQGLSLSQQIDLFSSARLLISPHGAGLTNMIFRRGQTTQIIEVFSPNHLEPCFLDLAQVLGFEHTAILGTPETSHWTSNINVDVEHLAHILARHVAPLTERTLSK